MSVSPLSPPIFSASAFQSTGDFPLNWLEPFHIDDNTAALAYEKTPDFLRARLKTAIAFQCHVWGEAPTSDKRLVVSRTAGFQRAIHERAAAWTLAVLDPAHASPARLVAALMPAVLAGVDRILVVCTGSPSPALCVALELAGLEDTFALPVTPDASNHHDLINLLTQLYDWNDDGRVLLFPTEATRNTARFMALRKVCRRLHISAWQDRPNPRLLLLAQNLSADATCAQKSAIQWAHGDGRVTVMESMTTQDKLAQAEGWDADFDACYHDPKLSPPADYPFCWGPGLEACWLADRLDLHFFRTTACSAMFAE